MFRARRFEMAAVALVLLVAQPAPAADDPLARPAFDKWIALEMKDADVVEVFRHLAVATGVPFVLEFESDPSLTLSFNAKNMSVRALLASIAHTYELKYEDAGDYVAVRPTSRKPAPRPAARPVRVSADSPPPAYRFKFQVRTTSGAVLSTPEVTTGLNQPLEIKQGATTGQGRVFLTFKVTPKQDLGDSLELLVESAEQRAVGSNRTITDQVVDTKVAGKGETRIFTSDARELVLVEWAREPRPVESNTTHGGLYELKLEIRPACGRTLPLGSVTTPIGEPATVTKLVIPSYINACIERWPARERMTFKLTPRGVTAEGLSLRVEAKVEPIFGRGMDDSWVNKIAGKGETVLYKSGAGNELVLTSWGILVQPSATRP